MERRKAVKEGYSIRFTLICLTNRYFCVIYLFVPEFVLIILKSCYKYGDEIILNLLYFLLFVIDSIIDTKKLYILYIDFLNIIIFR